MKAKCGYTHKKNERRKSTGRGTRLFGAAPLAFVFYGGKWTAVGIILALLLVLTLAYLSQRKPKPVKKSNRLALPAGEPTYRVVANKQAAAEEVISAPEVAPAEETPAPVMKKVTAAEAHRLLSDEAATEMMERATTEEKTVREAEQTSAEEKAEVAATETPREVYRAVCAQDSVAPVGKKHVVNVDTLSKAFASGDVVDLEALKSKGLLPKNAKAVKVLARGSLDKVLTVRADDFSADAVKMIVLTGGKAIRV